VTTGIPIEFSVGSYKTRKRYGVKKIQIDKKPVMKALRDWMKVSPNPEYVLVNVKNGTPHPDDQPTDHTEFDTCLQNPFQQVGRHNASSSHRPNRDLRQAVAGYGEDGRYHGP
jgi:hypothetical protein